MPWGWETLLLWASMMDHVLPEEPLCVDGRIPRFSTSSIGGAVTRVWLPTIGSGWDRNLCKKVLYKVLWCRVGFVLNYSKTHHCWQWFYSLLCPLSGRELQADFHGEGGCFCALMNAYVEVGHLSNVLLSVWFFNLNPNVFKVKSYHQEFLLFM